MVTSTFVSFVFAKRFIEVEALYLQTQNSFAQLECDSCEPWAGLKENPYFRDPRGSICLLRGRARQKKNFQGGAIPVAWSHHIESLYSLLCL